MEVWPLSPLVQEYPDEDFWEGCRAAISPAFFALTASPEPSVSHRAEEATPLISTKRDREEDYVEQVSTKRQRVSLEQHPEDTPFDVVFAKCAQFLCFSSLGYRSQVFLATLHMCPTDKHQKQNSLFYVCFWLPAPEGNIRLLFPVKFSSVHQLVSVLLMLGSE